MNFQNLGEQLEYSPKHQPYHDSEPMFCDHEYMNLHEQSCDHDEHHHCHHHDHHHHYICTKEELERVVSHIIDHDVRPICVDAIFKAGNMVFSNGYNFEKDNRVKDNVIMEQWYYE